MDMTPSQKAQITRKKHREAIEGAGLWKPE